MALLDPHLLPGPALAIQGTQPVAMNQAATELLEDAVEGGWPAVLAAAPEVLDALGDGAATSSRVWLDDRCLEVALGPATADGRLVLLRDVTADERHAAVVDTIADTVLLVDQDGLLRWRSENGLLWTGVPHEAVIGSRHLSRLHPEDIPEALRLLNDLVDRPGHRATFTARGRSIVDPETWEHVTLRGIAALDEPALRGVLVDVVIHEQGLRDDALGRAAGVSVAEIAPIGIVICTRTGETVYGNQAAHAILGPGFDPVLGVSWTDALSPTDRAAAEEAIAAAAAGGTPEPFPVAIERDGVRRWLRVLVRGQATDGGPADSVVCTLEDTTAETEARVQAHRLEALLDASEDLVAAFDSHGSLLWSNRAMRDLLRAASAALGEPATLTSVLGDDADTIVREARRALGRQGRWTSELVLDVGSRGRRTMSVLGVWDRGPDEGLASLIIARDITRLKEIEEELRVRATHDPLTGVANRALFEAELDRELTRRERSRAIGVLFADLDGFKQVNDDLGHASGDWLLQLVAERLRSSCRPEDLVARVGGDEFAVLVVDTDEDQLHDLAERIRIRIAEPIDWLPDLDFGVSVGVAHLPPGVPITSAAQAMRLADVAMYEVKRARATRAGAAGDASRD